MSDFQKVAVYFVASPLQYLTAKRIAEHFEPDARQVLIWYKPGLKSIINPQEWDACAYMPWPRLEPLPGIFGSHRQLRANIRLIASLIGSCEELLLHSAVFDTEAINYFLHALPLACRARSISARILPDGLISTRRYPLGFHKRVLQHSRKLRRLIAPELKYQCFSGDRIGSDAGFCDRIYVLPGLPHAYPAHKVKELPALMEKCIAEKEISTFGKKRALVIGQPLVDTGLLSLQDAAVVTQEIREWLNIKNILHIDYKAHPKDPRHELHHPDYRLIDPPYPLEMHMSKYYYDAIVGVRSSALLFARQIYPDSVEVKAFGWKNLVFKSPLEEQEMRRTFLLSRVELE